MLAPPAKPSTPLCTQKHLLLAATPYHVPHAQAQSGVMELADEAGDMAAVQKFLERPIPAWGSRFNVIELLEPLQATDTSGMAAKMKERLAKGGRSRKPCAP